MTQNPAFKVLVASPPEYERLVAEIYFGDLFVALLSQERDDGSIDIELADCSLDQTMVCRKVHLERFLEAIETARRGLKGE
jgi:hypothetical protein